VKAAQTEKVLSKKKTFHRKKNFEITRKAKRLWKNKN